MAHSLGSCSFAKGWSQISRLEIETMKSQTGVYMGRKFDEDAKVHVGVDRCLIPHRYWRVVFG
mgnify:FL=1